MAELSQSQSDPNGLSAPQDGIVRRRPAVFRGRQRRRGLSGPERRDRDFRDARRRGLQPGAPRSGQHGRRDGHNRAGQALGFGPRGGGLRAAGGHQGADRREDGEYRPDRAPLPGRGDRPLFAEPDHARAAQRRAAEGALAARLDAAFPGRPGGAVVRGGFAARPSRGRAGAVLSADRPAVDAAIDRLRGARALAPSQTRHGAAGRIHRGRRIQRLHRRDHQLVPATGDGGDPPLHRSRLAQRRGNRKPDGQHQRLGARSRRHAVRRAHRRSAGGHCRSTGKPEDRGDREHAAERPGNRRQKNSKPAAISACGSRSTTSAPAIRR